MRLGFRSREAGDADCADQRTADASDHAGAFQRIGGEIGHAGFSLNTLADVLGQVGELPSQIRRYPLLLLGRLARKGGVQLYEHPAQNVAG